MNSIDKAIAEHAEDANQGAKPLDPKSFETGVRPVNAVSAQEAIAAAQVEADKNSMEATHNEPSPEVRASMNEIMDMHKAENQPEIDIDVSEHAA